MGQTIGVLAVQGAFAEHIKILSQLSVNCLEIRKKEDITANHLDGIILPGGESTVMGKLLIELDMIDRLRQMINDGRPVLGTCAGLILLAKRIVNDSHVYLGTMDIMAKRNAYGRQLGSFHTVAGFKGIGEVPMTFIRAPYIESAAGNVEVLAKVDNYIVAARQDNMLVTAFHPELTDDVRIHEYFLGMIRSKAADRQGELSASAFGQSPETVKAEDADFTAVPNDPEYGLIPEKPIYTYGVPGSYRYLDSLRTSTGERLIWQRYGSRRVEGIAGFIDIYDGLLPSGKIYQRLYVNMYGKSNSTAAPKGFVLLI